MIEFYCLILLVVVLTGIGIIYELAHDERGIWE